MVQTLQNTVEVPQLQLVGFLDLVVDISVVVQRQIPMVVFRTIEIFQLQYTDKVIDAGCAARVFASRCRGGGFFTPDGAYDSVWDSVRPLTGKYTINYF